MSVHVSQLDPATLEYLSGPGGRPAASHYGVTVPRAGGGFAGPRAGWGLLTLAGLAAIGLAVYLGTRVPDNPRAELRGRSVPVAVLGGVGALLLGAGAARCLRRDDSPRLGNYLFADGAQIWRVSDSYVEAFEYTDALRAECVHWSTNGYHTHSVVTVYGAGPRHEWTISDKRLAERLTNFLQVIAVLRRSDDSTYRALVHLRSGHLNRIATMILDDIPADAAGSLPPPIDPPQLAATGPAATVGWGGAAVRTLVAGAVGAGLYFGLPVAFESAREHRLFTRAEKAAGDAAVPAFDAYLAEYPADWRSDVVREWRDDRVFARAKQESARDNSPGGLRAYLADRQNTRHRAEARELIGVYYDRAVADLKARAAALAKIDKNGVDMTLVAAMISLVEALKQADDPVLTVGFEAVTESEPKDENTRDQEKTSYELHTTVGKFKADLRSIRVGGADMPALIPYAQTFDPEYVTGREEAIFTRLSEAIRKGIKADILTLRRANPGEVPNIRVRYRVFPAGFVVPFTEVGSGNTVKRVIGLVREYFIDWTIDFRAPGAAASKEYQTKTRPGPNLLYHPERGDPDWAIYAVSLYSAFYDLSDKMIRAFGQDPGPAPDAFTFRGIGSKRTDNPARDNPPPRFP